MGEGASCLGAITLSIILAPGKLPSVAGHLWPAAVPSARTPQLRGVLCLRADIRQRLRPGCQVKIVFDERRRNPYPTGGSRRRRGSVSSSPRLIRVSRS